MKKIILVFIICFSIAKMNAQEEKVKPYNSEADAKADIANAVKKAKSEGKYVMIQAGGNWCGWCILFDDKVKATPILKKALDENYVSVHLNYSRENKDIFKELGSPDKYGFPVFVILDEEGKVVHTQDSGKLEEGKGHSTEKVMEFFTKWAPVKK
ncbi:thioredoxin family protein [uncultured Polaribacter sp.]|uniref:thioredoxin family protein n=1 Tax=uncultured Polaribacter sp. TaxID=174711 RepID=UPI0026318AA9|nr:thioredoxin family protein [uncultured Polaribacter sp.]